MEVAVGLAELRAVVVALCQTCMQPNNYISSGSTKAFFFCKRRPNTTVPSVVTLEY